MFDRPSAPEETSYRERHRSRGFPGGGDPLRAGHDRLQLFTRLRPSTGGGALFGEHQLQGTAEFHIIGACVQVFFHDVKLNLFFDNM